MQGRRTGGKRGIEYTGPSCEDIAVERPIETACVQGPEFCATPLTARLGESKETNLDFKNVACQLLVNRFYL